MCNVYMNESCETLKAVLSFIFMIGVILFSSDNHYFCPWQRETELCVCQWRPQCPGELKNAYRPCLPF